MIKIKARNLKMIFFVNKSIKKLIYFLQFLIKKTQWCTQNFLLRRLRLFFVRFEQNFQLFKEFPLPFNFYMIMKGSGRTSAPCVRHCKQSTPRCARNQGRQRKRNFSEKTSLPRPLPKHYVRLVITFLFINLF